MGKHGKAHPDFKADAEERAFRETHDPSQGKPTEIREQRTFAARETNVPQSLRQRAIEVFGDHQMADSWLRAENRALGGRAPLDVLLLPNGQEQIEDLLGRIEHGVYS